MTREPYTPRQFDELALRMLDLSGILRKMSVSARESGLESTAIHDRKALEYLAKLELWAHKAESDLQRELLQHRGDQLAQQMAAESGRGPKDPKK
jgi:predicted AAA+ superfamily ATPase